jgi:hypothetical protein
MNDTLLSHPPEQAELRSPQHSQHPQHQLPQHHPLPARRVGLIDRTALHLGLALIRWGRRPDPETARHERRATRIERALHALEQDTLLDEARTRLATTAGPRRLG